MNKKVLGSTKALVNPWRGYREPREWGKWFVIEWPTTHPDSHCDAGKHSPDSEVQICESCGWVPADATHREDYKQSLREKMELDSLMVVVERSSFSNLLFVGYRAYVDRYRDQLVGSPTFEEVQKWWNNLPTKSKDAYINKYGGSNISTLLRMLVELID